MTKRRTTSSTPLALKVIECINDVPQKMEAISDLNGGWRAQAYPLADPMPTVARDDLGTAMCSEPTRECGGFVVWQHINGSSRGQINQEQAITQQSAAQCEFIHAQLSWRAIEAELLAAQETTHRVWTGR